MAPHPAHVRGLKDRIRGFQQGGRLPEQACVRGFRSEGEMGDAQAGEQGNGAQGIVLRVPHGPEHRKAEDGVRTGFQRAAGPVSRGQERKLSPLFEAGGQGNEGQVRGDLPLCFGNMAQVSVMKGIVLSDDAENLHKGHLLLFNSSSFGIHNTQC